MSVDRLEGILAPFSFKLDGTTITIYEVTKSQLITGDTWYHVYLDIQYRGKRSKRFSLDCKGWKDLQKKLLIEISKFKLMVMLGVGV